MTALPPHDTALTRRAARARREGETAPALGRGRERGPRPGIPVARHARVRLSARLALIAGVLVGALVVVASASAMTAALAPAPEVPAAGPAAGPVRDLVPPAAPPPSEAAHAPLGGVAVRPQTAPAGPAPIDLCSDPDVTGALAVGDDAVAIAAAGGAALFRDAVATGRAPCVALDDPGRLWVVVDKQRPLVPIDYRPAALESPVGVPNADAAVLRADAAAALSAMAEASRAAGAGQIAVVSAFRSYETQVGTYSGHVAARGVEGADLVSARPGYSEHQSGLAVDVAPCDATCRTVDELASSAQGAWISAHAWEYGWIVRYEAGATPTTGYLPEPWHLRYIGPDLARAYHEGEWPSLEEFVGLPPAPDYTQ